MWNTNFEPKLVFDIYFGRKWIKVDPCMFAKWPGFRRINGKNYKGVVLENSTDFLWLDQLPIMDQMFDVTSLNIKNYKGFVDQETSEKLCIQFNCKGKV